MYSTSPSYREAAGGLRKGSVCSAHDDLAGVQGPDGSLVPADMLGPGVVENLDEYGRVCVHWVKADFDVCLDPSDVRPLGPDAHLISVQRRDKRMAVLGGPRHVVTSRLGLQYNWNVDVLPRNVIRAIRSDGEA